MQRLRIGVWWLGNQKQSYNRTTMAAVVQSKRRLLAQSASTTGNKSPEMDQQSKKEPSTEAIELAKKILSSPEFFDQPQLNKKAKRELTVGKWALPLKQAIQEFKRHPVDTGSSEVQVAVLSERIQRLQAHFEKNKKDIHSRRGLMALMQRRRKLLLYMAPRDPAAYVRVIEKYQIREGKGPSRVSDRPESWSPPRNKDDVTYRPKTWIEFKKPLAKEVKKRS